MLIGCLTCLTGGVSICQANPSCTAVNNTPLKIRPNAGTLSDTAAWRTLGGLLLFITGGALLFLGRGYLFDDEFFKENSLAFSATGGVCLGVGLLLYLISRKHVQVAAIPNPDYKSNVCSCPCVYHYGRGQRLQPAQRPQQTQQRLRPPHTHVNAVTTQPRATHINPSPYNSPPSLIDPMAGINQGYLADGHIQPGMPPQPSSVGPQPPQYSEPSPGSIYGTHPTAPPPPYSEVVSTQPKY